MSLLLWVIIWAVIISMVAGTFKKDPPPPKSTAPPKAPDTAALRIEEMRQRNHLG